ncbi:hypothetical protein CEXT_24001 [Caerostris extrusa]|uniref:Uncharacterized protein n=1 Tax=Caerostris extrusa TaxID=172846 RepID=A0AAV4NWQ0_CAEEX|nr:hypothetical protein CEXT_24001 [Caerostris extrusa]
MPGEAYGTNNEALPIDVFMRLYLPFTLKPRHELRSSYMPEHSIFSKYRFRNNESAFAKTRCRNEEISLRKDEKITLHLSRLLRRNDAKTNVYHAYPEK